MAAIEEPSCQTLKFPYFGYMGGQYACPVGQRVEQSRDSAYPLDAILLGWLKSMRHRHAAFLFE